MIDYIRWRRALVAGLAGGAAFLAALFLLFGPAQTILADPRLQSPKLLKVFSELEPLPRSGTDPAWVAAGVVAFGVLHGLLFALLAPALPGWGWRKGLSFGVVLWLTMVLWFEFFLLWNVMHEPPLLIGLELALWLAVNLIEGVVIALVYRAGSTPSPRAMRFAKLR